MGLAASQGRYLCLTARMSDLVYEGQQISQQRLQLSKETQLAADEYNDSMNNTILQATTPEGGVQRLTYDIITSQDPFSGLCMRIVDLDGNVVVPEEEKTLTASSKDEEGNDVVQSFTSPSAFIQKYMTDLSEEDTLKMSNWDMDNIGKYYKEHYPDSGVTVEVTSNINEGLRKQGEAFLYDKNCKDPEYLQQMLEDGQWYIQQVSSTNENEWENVAWQGHTAFSQVSDTSDDAAAEAKYEAAMAELQRHDKVLELRLEQIQTEENAVEKEIDSVKKVVSDNIDKSFKTFA